MTQLNTPYPATAYLTGFLRSQTEVQGLQVIQSDPALDLVLAIFSSQGLSELRDQLAKIPADQLSKPSRRFLFHFNDYIRTIDATVRFLQGRDPSLALRIVGRNFLPEGDRFAAIDETAKVTDDPMAWAFGHLGVQDQAKYLASLYFDDLADVIRNDVDPRFEFTRYGEKLAASQPTFDPLEKALKGEPTWVDLKLDQIAADLYRAHRPDVVGMTAPFPGNVLGAFRMAKVAREVLPAVKLLLGGGYVNTELRSLSEPKVFDYFDFITLDDGERPFLCVLEHLQGKRSGENLLRTFVRTPAGQVRLISDPKLHDIPHRATGTPTYDGLKLDRYLSIFEMLNPMHRIWSDGRWNKLTLAHGCYWKKCSFCDVSLDYIGRYDPAAADQLVDRMEALIRETGQSGFHFVDEAAPPALLRALSEKIIERKLSVTWWGNVRFEKAFTQDLAHLMARAGCVAVSGGLEVASDRLLKKMNKGVSIEQVAQVTTALTRAGIMVHAYLMYGFPTQTEAETIDSLEVVRQLFEQGCIQSAYWHRFSATVHSPIGKNPDAFGIRLLEEPKVTFARNDLEFEDPSGADHEWLGQGLRRALYNYMHGIGLDQDVRHWFTPRPGKKTPRAKAENQFSIH
ncbi:MAG: radical SAM protein [Bdellovibrionales bacterium]|nr:radical SAM protein [Bdellovibrionales bacterium]